MPSVTPFTDLSVGWTQRAATALAARLAHWCFAIEVRGLEHVPVDEPCLLCANHTSHIDTFALAAAMRDRSPRLVFLAARDYFFEFRWRSGLLRRLICLIPFDRAGGMAAAKHNLHLLAACRDAGRIIVLFPEGTRSPDGRMREFKPGAAMFADKLGLRVVPCRIDGAHAVLPKGKSLPRFHPLQLSFGAPLSLPPRPEHESGAARAQRYAAFAAELQRRIVDLETDAAPAARDTAILPA
jgi:long-chain acyl-CoA synthetase